MFRSFDPEESFTAWNAASQLITRTISNDNYAYTPVASIDQGYIANGLNQYSAVARTLSR
jgi:hypothetical protein